MFIRERERTIFTRPLRSVSASVAATLSTLVPTKTSSGIEPWYCDASKTGALSFTSVTEISTSVVSDIDGTPPSRAVTVNRYEGINSRSSAFVVVIAPVCGLMVNSVTACSPLSVARLYVIWAFLPTSESVALTTRTVTPIGASSNTETEYGAFSNTGEKLLASDTLT